MPPRNYLAAVLIPAAFLALTGCRKKVVASTPAPSPAPARPTPPAIDYAKIRPNELGRIPVVMYHEIGSKPDRNTDLNRTVASFRKDLELLHSKGFVPVNMSDVVNDRIDVPAGKSPVVLTFDDARASQFRLIETPDALKVDPNCALGILEAFVKAHPDWKLRATFYALPRSRATIEPFRQPGMGAQKLRYLLEKGMEIGNHSTYHKSFAAMTPAQIQEEIGGAHKSFQAQVPEIKIETFALPMGKYPKNKANIAYLRKGSYQGVPYDYKAVLLAAWRPIPSPSSKEYDPLRLERIGTTDGLNGLHYWIGKLAAASGERYVSDGDPNTISFPSTDEDLADTPRLAKAGKLVNAYEVAGGGAKPIISS